MTTISESELNPVQIDPCFQCAESEGDFYICGEGFLCSSCFAKMAGISEEDVFQNASNDRDVRARIRESLSGKE